MLGAHNVREESEEGRLELVSENWFAHPKWSQIGIINDIGLIQLPQKINFTDTIRPICLPSYSDVSDNFAGLDVRSCLYSKSSQFSILTNSQFRIYFLKISNLRTL